ncbi:hypothetical protein ADUPG1_012537 [Aduncisulcus paluster]|uniref:Protein kinase domain-containing protein n=1 Tax=Aduncisulcus paluster TaxID=2918883 RepID=A0ABQ5K327_9EUKA|nr:hypothetical protein ADUPG1_012537 [Aduncisulcus paluster]
MQEQHLEYVSYQMFLAVSFLHSGGLLHRDLKPSNILIGSDSIIKICDFGLARALVKTESSADFPAALMTDYIATRWFRSPELLLGDKNYDAAIDIWSLGCIIAEMFLQKPLFPGHSTLNQLALILKVIGHPTDEEIHACGSPHARTMLDALPDCVRKASRVTHGFSHISPAESPSLASIKEKGRPCLVRSHSMGFLKGKKSSPIQAPSLFRVSSSKSLSLIPVSNYSVIPEISSIKSLKRRLAYCDPSVHTVRVLRERLPNAPRLAIDLIARCLSFSPSRRISAKDALHHPYLARFARKDGSMDKCVLPVPLCKDKFPLPSLADDVKFSVARYRAEIARMVCKKDDKRSGGRDSKSRDSKSRDHQEMSSESSEPRDEKDGMKDCFTEVAEVQG